jgi:hypothetical protein
MKTRYTYLTYLFFGIIIVIFLFASIFLSGCSSNLNPGDKVSNGRIYTDDGKEILFRSDNKNVSLESINYGGSVLDDRVVVRYRNLSQVQKIRILVTNLYLDLDNPVRSTKSYFFYTGPITGTQLDSFYFNHSRSDLLDKSDSGSFVTLLVDDIEIETHYISRL